MNKTNIKRYAPLAILLITLVAGLVILNLPRGFRVTKTVPNSTGKIATSTGVFRVSLSAPIAGELTRDNLDDPDAIVQEIEKKDKQILVYVRPLESGVTYQFSLLNIRSDKQEVIERYTFKFKATYIPFEKLSDEEKAIQIEATGRNAPVDPIAQYLPHGTLDYNLTGSNETNDEGENIFVLNAELLLTAADVRIGRAAAIKAYKKEVLDFIISKGFKPNDYLIRYTVSAPTL